LSVMFHTLKRLETSLYIKTEAQRSRNVVNRPSSRALETFFTIYKGLETSRNILPVNNIVYTVVLKRLETSFYGYTDRSIKVLKRHETSFLYTIQLS
jgi:hypothetical protein